jgi:hypothetical protein
MAALFDEEFLDAAAEKSATTADPGFVVSFKFYHETCLAMRIETLPL